jgi:hypothetical protein
MPADGATAAAIVALFLCVDNKKPRRRRVWVRGWIARRETLGCYSNLIRELRAEDTAMYKNFVRLSLEDFDALLLKIHTKKTSGIKN